MRPMFALSFLNFLVDLKFKCRTFFVVYSGDLIFSPMNSFRWFNLAADACEKSKNRKYQWNSALFQALQLNDNYFVVLKFETPVTSSPLKIHLTVGIVKKLSKLNRKRMKENQEDYWRRWKRQGSKSKENMRPKMRTKGNVDKLYCVVWWFNNFYVCQHVRQKTEQNSSSRMYSTDMEWSIEILKRVLSQNHLCK